LNGATRPPGPSTDAEGEEKKKRRPVIGKSRILSAQNRGDNNYSGAEDKMKIQGRKSGILPKRGGIYDTILSAWLKGKSPGTAVKGGGGKYDKINI